MIIFFSIIIKMYVLYFFFFFFNDPPPTEISTLSLHDALPIFLAIVALLFPDLQVFNLVDDIVAGTAISLAVFVRTALLGVFYTVIYTLMAVFVFYGKEL